MRGSRALTDREIEILHLYAAGHTSREIAEIFMISRHTIETHKQNMMNKMNAKNIMALVVAALRQKII